MVKIAVELIPDVAKIVKQKVVVSTYEKTKFASDPKNKYLMQADNFVAASKEAAAFGELFQAQKFMEQAAFCVRQASTAQMAASKCRESKRNAE